MRVGFVGLGIMGRPMALNLLKAGHDVVVWARRKESMAPLIEAGAQGAESPAGVAAAADIVFSMVADAPDVREVMLGSRGVVQSKRPGLIAVDMSTIPPAAAKSIGADLAGQGVTFLEAPVSGGEVGAVAGTLSIMVGGDRT
ncbi:MAG: NAD(P)-dependent oxidoreductase, partial [Fluviibacter sp.]